MFSRVRKGCVGNQGNNPNNVAGWELRPGGMLVQKRNSDANQTSTASVSTINIKVKYSSSYHEIRISSQASFGELKKMLTEHTGLHPQDQKLIFKKKERDSKSYLDVERVKDGSKITLVEDIASRERRMLEMLKKASTEKASKSMAEISLQVDKIAEQVAVLEAVASKGGILSEKDVDNLTEMLMTKLIRLDDIVAVGDLGLHRREQVRRVQKHIEILDRLKLQKQTRPCRNEGNVPLHQPGHSSVENFVPLQKEKAELRQRNMLGLKPILQQPLRHSESFVVTTKWETFD